MGKGILITSGKGGTGKTVFATNLGATLALEGYKVVLVDMDLGLRNLDLCLGLENHVIYDLSDALLGLCRIKQALIRDKRFQNLYLVAAPQFLPEAEITPLHVDVFFKKLKEQFDYVIIDTPAGLGDGFTLALEGADSAVIVATPEYTALRDADVVASMLKDRGIKDVSYILNRVQVDLLKSGLVPSLRELTGQMRVPLIGIVQEDDNIHIAANKGIPVVLKEGTYIRKNYGKIAETLLAIENPSC